MTGVSTGGDYLFLCVVGPGFDSTSPDFVRSRASQAAARVIPILKEKMNISYKIVL